MKTGVKVKSQTPLLLIVVSLPASQTQRLKSVICKIMIIIFSPNANLIKSIVISGIIKYLALSQILSALHTYFIKPSQQLDD